MFPTPERINLKANFTFKTFFPLSLGTCAFDGLLYACGGMYTHISAQILQNS